MADLGYDGVNNESEEFIAFDSNQIKSATNQVSEIEVLPGTLEEAKSHTLLTDKTSITGNNLQQRVFNINGNLILEHSKVVDENGEPLVVYHGTDIEFNEFDKTKGRANMDIQGMFFSPWELDAQGYGQNVKAFFLNIKNPTTESDGIKALNKFKGQNNAGVKAREYLVDLGYDGVNNESEEFIAFDPNQIKSATNNNGEFSRNSNDIRYSIISNYRVDVFDGNKHDIPTLVGDKIVRYVEPMPHVDSSVVDEYKNSVNIEAVEYVRNVLENKSDLSKVKKWFDLSKNISKRLIDAVRHLTGIDIENYKISIMPDAIIHISKRHGIAGKQDFSMSDYNDIGRIGFVLNNLDSLLVCTDNNGVVYAQKKG